MQTDRAFEGFEPKSGEPVFVKSQISPYTNEAFKQAMLSMRGNEVVIAGYGSTMCCLSTIISGSALGLRHSFIHDASWARALGDAMPEADAHRRVTAIIGIHGKIRTTAEVLAM
jgi:ureidoacrylate peracid hydrolase